jgi:hypothetical protein
MRHKKPGPQKSIYCEIKEQFLHITCMINTAVPDGAPPRRISDEAGAFINTGGEINYVNFSSGFKTVVVIQSGP